MRRVLLFVLFMRGWTAAAAAQATPAAGPTPPDDTPSIKVGTTLFTDYTYTQSPQTKDADGNTINPSQFNVGRAYINVTGNASHIVAFRITPDIARESGLGSSLAGSLTFRIKYAFAQVNLDDWMTKGSWTRLGIHQTPWVEFQEGIYRYRFQGTVFSEREGFLSSSDAGASLHYNFPANYGDLHIGLYNGDTYSKAEVNDQKAIQIRGTVRPFAAGAPAIRGLRAHLFYDGDSYLRHGDRKRFIGSVTFEHTYLNAGAEYLSATDQPSVTRPERTGKGYSIWATPKGPRGFEGLLRYDRLKPDRAFDEQLRTRTILGVSYWFPHEGSTSAALLLDYDSANVDSFVPGRPKETKVAVHALVSF